MNPARFLMLAVVASLALALGTGSQAAEPSPAVLPGTAPLELEGDIASELVDGVD